MSDWWTTREGHQWVSHVRHQVLPKIRDSAFMLTIDPSSHDPDIKIAVELGLGILLGKPIVVVSEQGKVPNRGLARVADAIVEADYRDPAGTAARLADAMRKLGLEMTDG